MRISDWSSDVCSSDLPAYLIEDESEPRSGSTTLWAGIAIVAVLAWLGGMVWLARGIFAAPPAPIELVQFLAALCVPPALIGILWLLGMRTSRAEARRFGHRAQAMRAAAPSPARTQGPPTGEGARTE